MKCFIFLQPQGCNEEILNNCANKKIEIKTKLAIALNNGDAISMPININNPAKSQSQHFYIVVNSKGYDFSIDELIIFCNLQKS